ncbi:Uncharacterised protein [Mycobacteroides abscessus subsp. abscessus]|nr:Uncharacterised protein [Mycobacteroides abscessus subsp. abscessus]
MHQHVVGSPFPRVRKTVEAGSERTPAQSHALRCTGGSRGIHDERSRLGIRFGILMP